AGEDGQERRKAGLNGRHDDEVADIGDRRPGGGEALPGDPEGDEQGGDQRGDGAGEGRPGKAAAGTPGARYPGHRVHLRVEKASSIQARVLALTASASSSRAGSGSIMASKPGLRPPAGSRTGYIQLVSGRVA